MTGVELIAAERQRQIVQEGWTEEHDREHPPGALALAAAVYALPGWWREKLIFDKRLWRILWPFDELWFKPDPEHTAEGRVRELAKAGALAAAEIDKLLKEAWRP